MKLFVFLAVIALVSYALWQKWRNLHPQTKQLWGAIFGMAGAIRQARKQVQQNGSVQATPAPSGSSRMVACTKCHLHVPENEGVMMQGQFYCCVEHTK